MIEKESNPFEIQVYVEFEDVDMYQIAHHTKLIAYLERARARYLVNHLGFDLAVQKYNIVLYDLEIQFKKTAHLMDLLTIQVFIEETKTFQIVLGYWIKRAHDIVAKAKTSLVFIDPHEKKLIPVPDPYTKLESHN